MLRRVFLGWDSMGTLKYKLKSRRPCSLKWCVKEAPIQSPPEICKIKTKANYLLLEVRMYFQKWC